MLILSLKASAQTAACKVVHNGKFKIYSKETGTTFIRREKNIQIEKNADYGAELIFNIIWITECDYELRPKQVISGDTSILNKGLVLKVHIKGVTKSKYIAETTSNFSDAKLEFVVQILN